jgi:isochorismate synthase
MSTQPDQLSQLIADGGEFGLVAFPGETEFRCFPNANRKATMEIVPWLGTYANRIVIGADNSALPPAEPICTKSTTYVSYIRAVEAIVAQCHNRHNKTVYSRVICGQISNNNSWNKIARQLFESHPATLRFAFSAKATGAWLGATPELLLDLDKATGQLRTMAFAGTRQSGSNEPWDDKNITENRFVINYIAAQLQQLGIEATIAPLTTVTYGNVEHLCANITAQADANRLPDIIDALNPTPALCGYPKADAVANIATFEQHQRGCYGGIIGIDTPERYRAFVNLRSLRFDGTRYCIYGGGGITEQSIPADEYAETTAKTQLLSTLCQQ